MQGLKLFTGNRLEILVDKLAEVLSAPLSSPLMKEIVVVQSKGMERWVSMEIARRHSICANYRFPFPNALVHEIFNKVIGDVPDPSPFDPSVMSWRIMKLLPLCLSSPQFRGLAIYLRDDPTHLKLYQLAQRISDLFDQYLLFRSEMISGWERGKEDHWQALLWRELTTGIEPLHRASLWKAFLEKIREPLARIGNLPERVAIFGISSLPPFHLEFFAELSRFTQVNLFLMNPCKEYWADIKSDREMGKIASRTASNSLTPDELHLEKGNSLLASMGALGRDFFQLIQGLDCEGEELFEEPGEANLLCCLQSDILRLGSRDPEKKTVLDPEDRSVVIHSCHGPLREIEVLYDNLLELLEKNPDISPRDILVMTPDINTYAPFIQAVFDAPEDPALRIPFSITDRSIRKESQIIEGFLSILDLSGSRFGAPQVLGILESAGLRRKFDFSETDLDLMRRWVRATRIRWGVDGKSRAQMGFDEFSENSWKAGLDRLLLGYAMPGRGERLFHSILPYDDIEGTDSAVLGRFLAFIHRLFSDVNDLAHPKTLNEWSEFLMLCLDRFFEPDADSEKEVQTVRQALSDLVARQELSGFDEKIGLEVIKSHLAARLDTEGLGLGFITGGVTFCAMLPMRSIPFEVICLVGMDDGAFPRQTRSLGFDLMARTPRPGDRSQRNDDRYLFLEAILSARRRLYISHVGQSTEDNGEIPPSVLVSELLDVLEKGFAIPGKKLLDHVTTRHRLQPFSPQYFKEKDGKFFSFSRENCRVSEMVSGRRKGLTPFVSSAIAEPETEWKTVDLEQLCRFFGNPARFFLERRLQMELQTRSATPDDREAFRLNALDQYHLEQDLVDKRTGGEADIEGLLPVVRASGRLPHGVVGQCSYEMMARDVRDFFAKIEPFCKHAPLEPIDLDMRLPPFTLIGRIQRLTPMGLAHYRPATVKPKDRLNLWIFHLALNMMDDLDWTRSSFLIGTDNSLEFGPVENAAHLMARLLDLYWTGLTRPLRFFPLSSYAYAKRIVSEKKPDRDAMKAARREWEGDFVRDGECKDSHMRLCFNEIDPLDGEFQRLALEIFEPLMSHQQALEQTLDSTAKTQGSQRLKKSHDR